MGLFKGNNAATNNAGGNVEISNNGAPYAQPLTYPHTKKVEQLKAELTPNIDNLVMKLAKSDEQKMLSISLITMQQNEIMIKYLDDISKKLDNLNRP